jgi:DNA-binding MarR family transcriptional regulator
MDYPNNQTMIGVDRPGVVIVADRMSVAQHGKELVAAASCRLVATLKPENACAGLVRTAGLDVVWVELTSDTGDYLDALLDELESSACEGRYCSVVSVPIELVDLAHARLEHRDVQILCAPQRYEQLAALGLATAERSLSLHDIGTEGDALKLRKLYEETERLARVLMEIAQSEPFAKMNTGNKVTEAPLAYRPPGAAPTLARAEQIKRIINLRRHRDQLFQAELFADPAWDMLLDLAAARMEGRDVAVSSLCIASAVPPTTALRWIKTMTEKGLLIRRSDPIDGRRIFIVMSDRTASAMDSWLAAVTSDSELALNR